MSQVHLLKTRRFLPLFLTQFLGAFNDNVFKNALVIWIAFQATTVMGLSSEQAVIACQGIFIFPYFLFSATAGQLADKYEKSKLVQITKVCEIIFMTIAAIGFLMGWIGFLVFVLFLMGFQATFFGPLKYSILPQHLAEDELVGGNALIESGTFLAILIGTLCGGVGIALKPHGPFVVAVSIVALSILGWLTSRKVPHAAAADPSLQVEWNPVRPTIQILGMARKNRPVFLSIMGISWFWFFGGAFLSLLPNYCKNVLHGDEHLVTLFLALFSIGIGFGSVLCERISGKRLELGLVPFGSIGMTVFALDLFLVGSPQWTVFYSASGIRILVDLFFISVFSGFFTVPLYTVIQERSENTVRSRIIAANNILNALFMVVSALMLGVLLAVHVTIPELFLVLAVLNAAVAVYIYFLMPEFFLRFIIWILANLIYRLRSRGLENIPHTGPAILVSNHVTFVDWLIIAAAVKRPVRLVMDHNYAKGWFFRKLLQQGKVILISPAKENPALLLEAFEKIATELKSGELVCIFPEGRLTLNGEMGAFRPGIEKMIETVPVPVVPMALRGLWGSFFTKERKPIWRKLPGKLFSRIELVVGTSVPAREVSAVGLQKTVSELRGDVR